MKTVSRLAKVLLLLSLQFVITVQIITVANPTAVYAVAKEKRLTILFTHDLHSHLTPHRERNFNGEVESVGGFSRLSSIIAEKRKTYGKSDGIILVDAGDFAEGTLYHTIFSKEAPELHLLRNMGYDVITFGNHDFDFYPIGLAEMLYNSQPKPMSSLTAKKPLIVCSNITFSKKGSGDRELKNAFKWYPVHDYEVIERNGLRIGIFGLLGKDAAEDAPFAPPVVFTDQLEAAKRVVKLLKEHEKVDLIVCLSHCGTNPVHNLSEDENLAVSVPDIDVIISGHTHTLLRKPIIVNNKVIDPSDGHGIAHKTFIGSVGAYGTYLGRIRLTVPDNRHGISLDEYELKKVHADIAEDKEIASCIAMYMHDVEKKYLNHFGYSFRKLIAAMPFDCEAEPYGKGHPGENGLGNLIVDSYRNAVKKAEGSHHIFVNAAVNVLGNIRAPLFHGEITTSDVFETASLGPEKQGYCGNTIIAIYLKGSDLKQFLEVETTIAPLKQDAHLSVAGIRFRYNPHRMMFDRVSSVEVQEPDSTYKQLSDNKLYRVAVNSYVANLVDLLGKKSFGILNVSLRDSSGRVITNPVSLTVMTKEQAGRGEKIELLREWVALAEYLSAFPVRNNISQIPEHYKGPEGRIIIETSWNPVDLLAGGNWITWTTLLLIIVVVALLLLLLRLLIRNVRQRMSNV